ncbi:hypothetical protein NDU88_007149, partial [Pleurodeles waltl]
MEAGRKQEDREKTGRLGGNRETVQKTVRLQRKQGDWEETWTVGENRDTGRKQG